MTSCCYIPTRTCRLMKTPQSGGATPPTVWGLDIAQPAIYNRPLATYTVTAAQAVAQAFAQKQDIVPPPGSRVLGKVLDGVKQLFGALFEVNGIYFLIFRGTQTPLELLADVSFKQQSNGVSRGFATLFAVLKPKIALLKFLVPPHSWLTIS